MVIYYQDPAERPDCAWRWKYVSNGGMTVEVSDRTFKTRRGAMDDWNKVQSVVARLQSSEKEQRK